MDRYAGLDIAHLLEQRADWRGNHPFLIWESGSEDARSWSYGEFAAEVRRVAGGLSRLAQPGDRIFVYLDNCPEAILTFFACAYIGAIAVMINTRATIDDAKYFADKTQPVCAVTSIEYAAHVSAALPQKPIFFTDTATNGLSYSELAGTPPPLRLPLPSQRLSIQFTSGTTSRPKGVVWTHANALWGGQTAAAHQALTKDDVHLTYLPIYHTNAQVYSVLSSLWAGATVVLQRKFSASRFWDVAIRNGCTWTSMIPFCLKALESLEVPTEHAFRCWGTAASFPLAADRYQIDIIGWYGMTETITHPICGQIGRPGPVRSIGNVTPAYRIAILNAEGRPCGPGETGDLFVEGIPGLSVFLEYWQDQAATSAAFDKEGRLITGDRITVGKDGFLYFSDRSKDMLKVSGENVSASEVENAVLMVKGVVECAVVGKSDPMKDEVPVAFVVIDGPEGDIISAIQLSVQNSLSDFKRPKEIIVVDALPKGTLDKVSKAELRQLLT